MSFSKAVVKLRIPIIIVIISSMCMLMARGAVISMLCVIFILPALLTLCDKLVCATTFDMKKCREAVKQ